MFRVNISSICSQVLSEFRNPHVEAQIRARLWQCRTFNLVFLVSKITLTEQSS